MVSVRDECTTFWFAKGRAGMPVQVLVPLRARTALSYALEPLVGSFWGSFREH